MPEWFPGVAGGRTGSPFAHPRGMRLVAGLLALTLTGSLAFADEGKAPEPQPAQPDRGRGKVGLRVVRVMPESHQALLFDKNRGTHVLADVGSSIGDYTVTEIDEDEVTLSSQGREVVLAAPEPAWGRRRDADVVIPAKKLPAADTKAAAPADPYASTDGPAADGPADPYAEPAVRTADAPKPLAAGEGGVRVAPAPSSVPMTNPYDEAALDAALTAPTAPAVTVTEMEVDPYGEPVPTPATTSMDSDPYAEPTPTPVAAPTPAVKSAPAARPSKKAPIDNAGVRAFAEAMSGEVSDVAEEPAPAPAAPAPAAPATAAPAREPATQLSRTEVNTALADFGVLTQSVRGAFTPAGARLDVVAPGSVFAKAGLRNGDVITAVDGQPLKSIDDAADLYIRAGSARTASVQLLRAGKPMTLRLAIQ